MDFFKAIQYVLHYSEQQKVMICGGKKGMYCHQSLSVLLPFLSPNAVIGRFRKYSTMIG